jgi:site-specific recombinase XerD
VRKKERSKDAVYCVVDPEKHLSGVALWKLTKWYCKRSGVESKITAHSFRVVMVTDMQDGGMPIQHVQAAV